MKFGYVSIVGRPNAGKSTLLNRIVGEKLAIVSDKPQTTRNRILAVRNAPGSQMVLLDTPGIHRPLHRMNVRMVDLAVESLRQVDVVALMVDASERIGRGDRYVLDLVRDVRVPLLLALNKVDLMTKPKLLPMIDWFRQQHDFADIVPISALTGDGVDRLEQALVAHLPDGEAMYPEDYLTDRPERFLIAETIREKLLANTHAELPFSTAVVVDGVDESDPGLLRIYSTILVEHESQKPIVIGRGGDMIKRIGTQARLDLEGFFETRVFLDLRVKVKPRWRDDERVLNEIDLSRQRE